MLALDTMLADGALDFMLAEPACFDRVATLIALDRAEAHGFDVYQVTTAITGASDAQVLLAHALARFTFATRRYIEHMVKRRSDTKTRIEDAYRTGTAVGALGFAISMLDDWPGLPIDRTGDDLDDLLALELRVHAVIAETCYSLIDPTHKKGTSHD